MTSRMRPPRDEILMANAWQWSLRSTCERAQVGAVVSRDSRILMTGYNGAPAGMAHCDHSCDCRSMFATEDPGTHTHGCRYTKPCTVAVHAEANVIAWTARYGVPLEGATLHTTRVPCLNCAMLVINAGIVRVVWDEEHRDMTGFDLLEKAGLQIERWKSED